MSSQPELPLPPAQDDWSFDACQARLRIATSIVLGAIRDYDLAAQRAADAEAVYRSEMGKVFAQRRDAGDAVDAAKIAAHKECARLSRERDYAKDRVKVAADDVQGALDSRRSLWRLIEWARGRDLAKLGQSTDEREPAGQWP